MHQLFSNRRLVYIATILIVSNILIAGISILVIYNKSISEFQNTLIDVVERQKSLVTTLLEQGKSEQEILQLIKTMREKHYGIGRTGEFVIGRRTGDSVTFILASKTALNFKIINAESHGWPMYLALLGKDGYVIADDYNGNRVLAAYTYIPSLQWGIVAKIPIAEINLPYYKAISFAVFTSVLLILLSIFLFIKISNPLIYKLADNEETYRMLFDSINDAVFVSELSEKQNIRKFIQVNDIACQRLGYSREELLAMSPFDINSEKAKQGYISLFKKILENKSGIVETEHLTKDGRIIPVEISTKVTQFRNKTIFHSIARDITERKQAELELKEKNEEIETQSEEYLQINEELNQINAELLLAKEKAEESEEKYRSLYENAPLSYQSLNEDGCFKDINPMWLKTLGYNREEVIGKWYGAFLHPDYVEHFKINFPAFKKRGTISGVQFKLRKKNGDYIHVAFEGCIGYKPDGSFKQTYCVFQDITEQKKAENELISAKEKAEESDRLKTAFLQNMSHEIRTPMNAIMGFSELLVNNYNNKPKLEKFSEIINQRCLDLLDIINGILDIAKIESGQLPINTEVCNLDDLFSELTLFFKEHQKRIGKQHINFSLKRLCDPSETLIFTDKVKLKQILINLIGNAFKFTNNGNIEGGCKTDANHRLIFYVSDTGIGIPPEKQHIIFERFIQIEHGPGRLYGGTGLGLSIVKGLVDLLGGKIWLESEPGKGSTFYFSVPFKKSEILHSEPFVVNEPESFNFQNKTILIVEDDQYNTEYIKEILSDSGLNILHTIYGNEAVQIAATQKPDLVLMDIRLPDLNGYEATRMMKQLNPKLKIIAQTAYVAMEDHQKATDAGCIDYISKPLKRGLLLSMLNLHLSKK